ncbi:helix-turn-helix transcriptional regulator [Companilactobacillus mishanensis]|uniref:Helix-turn-helix domain-containing protein n=1 Tax=Companilactobacillus mishanensis TaxID=2486008 RepID=A0ABW9P7S6_9LACO|nr:helix-turn-helix domain-containing protein [Companilactobacillus mishanensis]MQS45222.1 helix-turn-helix domain-containing protein [Companilactobacillus mishanensis]
MLKISNDSLLAIHPGYYIKEYLEEENMNQRELADRMNTNEKQISLLLNGRIELDNQLIEKLSLALGTSNSLWKNLNDKFLKTKEEIEKDSRLEEGKSKQKSIDYGFWND